jgi:putative NADPH-quinone reductase
MKKNYLKIFAFFCTILILLSSCDKNITDPQQSFTFIEQLPNSVKNDILWYCDYEDNSFYKWEGEGTETPNAGGGIFVTDSVNSIYGIEQSLHYSGKFSAFATIKNAVTPTEKKAIRFMRWTDKPWDQNGDYFPNSAYYSTFFLMKHSYNPAKSPDNDPEQDGGWWNIFQFKSKNNTGSMPVVTLDVYNEDNKMYFGLVIKDYPDDNSSDYNFEYILQENPIPIKVNEWNHIEVFYEKSNIYSGQVIVWQNNVKIFEKHNIRTVLPPDETAVWGIGNYTDFIKGDTVNGTATIYFDDAIVSKIKISDYINLNGTQQRLYAIKTAHSRKTLWASVKRQGNNIMKVYILLGHPDSDSFNGQIFETYCNELTKIGHEIKVQRIGEMKFDPIIWKGYKIVQELEPDLKTAQENILWCDKWTIIYPIWWGSMPAILKGFFDRTLYSGFAYKYHKNDPFWDKLLKGRSADLITTCDAQNGGYGGSTEIVI